MVLILELAAREPVHLNPSSADQIADLRENHAICTWSLLVDNEGNIVADDALACEAGPILVEYPRLAFDLTNPYRSDLVLRTQSDADDGFGPFLHEHPGIPPSVRGPVVIADPGNDDGARNATVFGDVAIPAGRRAAWEVEVTTFGVA